MRIRRTRLREIPRYWAVLRVPSLADSSRILWCISGVRSRNRVVIICILLGDFIDGQDQFLTKSLVESQQPALFRRGEIIGNKGFSNLAKVSRELFESLLDLSQTWGKGRGAFRSQSSQRVVEELAPFRGLSHTVTLDESQPLGVAQGMLGKGLHELVLIILR